MSAAASKKTPSPPYVVETRNREVLRGLELMSPRPAMPHAVCAGQLYVALSTLYGRRRGTGGPGRPGGWVLVVEPELHLEGNDPIIPDIAGWRSERMPLVPRTAAVKLPPDWVCEVLSPSTARYDRGVKLDIYGAAKVGHIWLCDPLEQRIEVFTLDGTTYRPVLDHLGESPIKAPPFTAEPVDLIDVWPMM